MNPTWPPASTRGRTAIISHIIITTIATIATITIIATIATIATITTIVIIFLLPRNRFRIFPLRISTIERIHVYGAIVQVHQCGGGGLAPDILLRGDFLEENRVELLHLINHLTCPSTSPSFWEMLRICFWRYSHHQGQ
jgi:hypothetical protein